MSEEEEKTAKAPHETKKTKQDAKPKMMLQCQYCAIRCESHQSLKKHHSLRHSDDTMSIVWVVEEDATKFRCLECDLVYPSNVARSSHWYGKHASTAAANRSTASPSELHANDNGMKALKRPSFKDAACDPVVKKKRVQSVDDEEEEKDDDDDIDTQQQDTQQQVLSNNQTTFDDVHFDGNVPLEVAFSTLFPLKSADSLAQWLLKLDDEDIATVGDLRALEESNLRLLCTQIGASIVLGRCLYALRGVVASTASAVTASTTLPLAQNDRASTPHPAQKSPGPRVKPSHVNNNRAHHKYFSQQ